MHVYATHIINKQKKHTVEAPEKASRITTKKTPKSSETRDKRRLVSSHDCKIYYSTGEKKAT